MLPRKHDCLERAPDVEPLDMHATWARASMSLLQDYLCFCCCYYYQSMAVMRRDFALAMPARSRYTERYRRRCWQCTLTRCNPCSIERATASVQVHALVAVHPAPTQPPGPTCASSKTYLRSCQRELTRNPVVGIVLVLVRGLRGVANP